MNAKTINARLRILKNSPFADRPETKADIRELERLRREAAQKPDEVPFDEDNEPEPEDE
jgi:hypothetical protein